jgi:hypothetical protein
VVVKRETSPDSRGRSASAVDALQEAREIPPGSLRTDALKKAGLLRRVADSHALIFAQNGRSPKWLESKQLSLPQLDATATTRRSKTLDRALSLIAAFIVVAIIMVARY